MRFDSPIGFRKRAEPWTNSFSSSFCSSNPPLQNDRKVCVCLQPQTDSQADQLSNKRGTQLSFFFIWVVRVALLKHAALLNSTVDLHHSWAMGFVLNGRPSALSFESTAYETIFQRADKNHGPQIRPSKKSSIQLESRPKIERNILCIFRTSFVTCPCRFLRVFTLSHCWRWISFSLLAACLPARFCRPGNAVFAAN